MSPHLPTYCCLEHGERARLVLAFMSVLMFVYRPIAPGAQVLSTARHLLRCLQCLDCAQKVTAVGNFQFCFVGLVYTDCGNIKSSKYQDLWNHITNLKTSPFGILPSTPHLLGQGQILLLALWTSEEEI